MIVIHLEEAFVEEINGITAFEGRIYPLFSPEANAQKGTPYLIYDSSEGVRTKTLDGYQRDKSVPIEVNVISNTYSSLKVLTRSVIALIIGMEQRVIGTNGPYIHELKYEKPEEIYEATAKLHRSNFFVTFHIIEEG